VAPKQHGVAAITVVLHISWGERERGVLLTTTIKK